METTESVLKRVEPTRRTLARLALEFQKRSTSKHQGNRPAYNGTAKITHYGSQDAPYEAWRIVYYDSRDSWSQQGICIGKSATAAVRWLRRQQKDRP